MRLAGVDADAEFTEFCRREWPRLVGSLALYTGDRDLAEELAQETLIRVFERWTQVRDADSPTAWTHRVGLNLAKSHYRRRVAFRRIRRLELDGPDSWEPDTALQLALREAVSALPEPQRQVLVLRYVVDLSVQQVAALMECPTNTVKSHARRGLEALREVGLTHDPLTEASSPVPEGRPR